MVPRGARAPSIGIWWRIARAICAGGRIVPSRAPAGTVGTVGISAHRVSAGIRVVDRRHTVSRVIRATNGYRSRVYVGRIIVAGPPDQRRSSGNSSDIGTGVTGSIAADDLVLV